jgi:hypothetical protein
MTRRRAVLTALWLAIGGAAVACGPGPERPLLTATGLKFHNPGVTGMPVDVTFDVQNPNPRALNVERFDYEVLVNGHSIGRGFVPEALPLEAFKGRQVTSRFNVNYFGIPGAVKEVLDQDRIDATVRGTFYVERRLWSRRLPWARLLPYSATSTIPLKRDAAPRPAPASGLTPAVPAAPGKTVAPKKLAPKTPLPKKPVPKNTVPLPSLK